MTPAERVLAYFDRISEAPDAIQRLRRFILDLAVRGRLAEQNATDPLDTEVLKRIEKQTGDQTDLPGNWRRARVGAVLEFRYGKQLNATSRRETGPVPVFGSNGVVGFTDEPLTERASIIVGRKGSAGALNLCNGPSWTTDVAYYVEAPAYFDIRYLEIALSVLDLGRLGKGVKPGLNRDDAYGQLLRVPPLAEQHRIVAKVDELMALCDRLEVAQKERESRRDRLVGASLRRLNVPSESTLRADTRLCLAQLPRLVKRALHVHALRETVRNLAVCGHLAEQDPNDESVSSLVERLRRDGAKRFLKSAGRDELAPGERSAPTTWCTAALGDICRLVTSGSRGWAEYYSESGAKFIRAQNIRFGSLRLDDLTHVNPPATAEGARTRVESGDLLIVITGAGVTNPALVDRDLSEAYVSQHVGLVRPTDPDVSRWILLCLMAPAAGRKMLVERAYGAGKPGLNLETIRALRIPLPPGGEQGRILERVRILMSLCDRLEAQLEAGRAAQAALLEATLREALADSAYRPVSA